MDRLFADMGAVKHADTNAANPVDPAWNVAVRHIANKVCPNGWDEIAKFEDAPTTLRALNEYAVANHKLGIATEDCDGTIFDCADTNVHLRAWHDSVHFRYQLAFNVAGEAAAVYVQAAQVYRLYGVTPQSIRWVQLLLADILGLVLHVKKTGKYPKNKRAGCVNEAPRWKHAAEEIGAAVYTQSVIVEDFERVALALARQHYGNPAE